MLSCFVGGLNKIIMSNTNGFTEQIELHELREKCKKQQELIDTLERTSERHRKHANEFIKSVADMLNMDTDGVGYDGLTLSLDDFKDAIRALGHEA
jgi:hypothetical protein